MMLTEKLTELGRKPEKLAIGLMSGTSMDGIDAALVRLRGTGLSTEVRLERFLCFPYEPELRVRLLAAASGTALASSEHARLEFEIAASFAKAALAVCAAACMEPRRVDFIGSHGQTLFHHARGGGARGPEEATWQAGSLPALSALTGLLVVGDFRTADVVLGGTGAPLVPYVDFLLRRSPTESRIVLNLGGIANLTYLRAGCSARDVLAWDVGPANMILDGLAQELLGSPFDRDGARAAAGHADEAWVAALLEDDFFTRPAPKAAGREEFGGLYVQSMLAEGRRRGLSVEDLLATAVALTAAAIQRARTEPPLAGQPLDALYATGGGRHNRTLLADLAARLHPVPVRGIEALGTDPDAKEAVDFAVLANETLAGHAGNLAQVTGAKRPCVLGSISAAGLEPQGLDSLAETR